MAYYYKMVPDGTYCLTGYDGSDASVQLPQNITVSILNDKLYRGHTEITEITLPDSITQIGGFVFDGCTNLKKITLPPRLEGMWQYALTRMAIEEIEFPGTLKHIIPFTCSECKELKKVIINEGTVKIEAWAFKDCTALEEVILPEGITIHEQAFEGCKDIKLTYK